MVWLTCRIEAGKIHKQTKTLATRTRWKRRGYSCGELETIDDIIDRLLKVQGSHTS